MNTKNWNHKNLTRLITAFGVLSAVLTLIASAMSGWLIFKLVRYVDRSQKALPKVEKAAQLYIENNTKQNQKEEI